jgi:hypothetical protein
MSDTHVHSVLDYSLEGVIIDEDSGRPVPGLRVRAQDRDFFRNHLLGDGYTDENGRYEITFEREDFTGPIIRLNRHPEIFIHVYAGDDRLLFSSDRSIVVDAERHTTIDIRIPYFPHDGEEEPGVTQLFGLALNLPETARLSAQEVLTAYRLMRGASAPVENEERIRRAFPGNFARKAAEPECGNGIFELFRYLMAERKALDALADADTDPYLGATVHEFFTANIVVKYTTDATLPGGATNPNKLPAASATLPAADSTYSMPNGTTIGTVRKNLADLHPANTEVAPTYIQKVGLLAEYALSHYIAAPFSYLDPRGGATRLEFRILGLTPGVAGYAVPSDFHMELNTSNSDSQNLGTVPHELFHLVQFRYNAGAGPANGIRGSMMEGGARLLEESINETPNRYVESAVDGDLSGASVPRKGLLTFPEETLIDVGGSQSLLRYAAGLLWKYVAEQHSTHTGAADEPAIGVDAYRKIIERMTTALDNFTIAAVRNGRAQLSWYGTFDQFGYYDAAATELGSHETTWGNFLIANYFHGLWTPATAGFDRRFDYQEDEDPAGNAGAQLDTFSAVVTPGNAISIAQGGAVTKNVMGHKPYAAVYYEVTPSGSPAPRMLRVGFTATSGMSDPIVQIIRIGPGNSLVDVHRSDRPSWSKTINMAGLSKVVVIVASKEQSGNYTLTFDEVASATDVMVTRWNTAAGTEFEVDPRGWAWAWISPDVMVDSNDDLLDDTSVFFDHDNKLKVRLRNRGNAPADDIAVSFWYQKATPYLTSAGWIPVQNHAGVTQHLSGLSLAAGAEQWFGVDWSPVDDGTHHPHWCVKVTVTCPGDPNADNKIAFRNFANVAVGGPDPTFDALIRYIQWTKDDRLQIVPRGRRWTFEFDDVKALPKPVQTGCDWTVMAHRVTFGVPYELTFVRLRPAKAELPEWDGVATLEPHETGAAYPVDERTLPPGVSSDEIVTLAHVRKGVTIGGVSYRIGKS